MSMSTFPNRQAIDQAEPLEFAERVRSSALATFSYHGVSVQLDICTVDAALLADLERRIDRLLERDGWSAPTPPQAALQAQPAAQPAEKFCSVHNRLMKKMQHPNKLGQTHMCTAKVGDSWCDQKA